MKIFIYLAVGFWMVAGCTKKQEAKVNNGIIGRWILTEAYGNNGSYGTWSPYNNPIAVIIEFTADGKFNCCQDFQKAYLQLDRYVYVNNKLSMSSTSNNNTDTWYATAYDGSQLDISIFVCIEGCSYRYKPL